MRQPPRSTGSGAPDPQDALDARSLQLLAGGHLPARAQERLARMHADAAYTSDLSTAEFASVRSAGFDPVGQVLGTCVYQIGYSGTAWCGTPVGGFGGYGGMRGPGGGLAGILGGSMAGGGYPGGGIAGGGIAGGRYAGGGYAGGGYPGGMTPGATPPLDYSQVLPPAGSAAPLVHALRQARELAMGRLREECTLLGGDGVVGVRLTMGPFPGTAYAMEFQAIGTAVRAQGTTRPTQPFLSDLSGQDFAKLAHAGWIPAGLAMGIAVVVRHDDWTTRASASTFAGNVEIPGYTALVQEARHLARHSLEEDVHAVGAQGVVVSTIDLRIHEQECRIYEGGRDHIAEATIIGTAIARFPSRAETPPTLAVLRLNPRPATRGTA